MWQRQKRGKALKGLATLLLGVAFVGVLSSTSSATTGINQELSFEGKIVNSSGVNIADGTYNVEFKIYNAATSCNQTTGVGCTLAWTEDELVSASNGVNFSSGTFQVNLGAVNALPSNIWNTYPLYLSIQIGNTASCTVSTTFTSNCGGDGEMKPYILLTSTPYALNANQLGGLGSSSYGQLAGTSQVWTGDNTFQPQVDSVSLKAIQNSAGSPTQDIFDVKSAGLTNLIQVTGPAINASSITIQALQSGSTGGNLTLNGSGTGSVNLGNSGTASNIQVGNTTGSVAQTVNIGTNSTSSSTSTVNIGSTIGSGNVTTVQGSGVQAVVGNSSAVIQSSTGTALLTANTSNSSVGVAGVLSDTGGYSVNISGLSVPALPSANQSNTTGSAIYSYGITAVKANGGETALSPVSKVTNGNATLSSGNPIVITWTSVTGASSYNIYRTSSNGSGASSNTGLIGNVLSTSTLSFTDNGIAGTTAAPSGDTSGQFTVNGSALFSYNNTSSGTSNAFQVQNPAGTSLLTADTGLASAGSGYATDLTVSGTSSNFATFKLNNVHFAETSNATPGIGVGTCGTGTGTSATVTLGTGATVESGSFTLSTGSNTQQKGCAIVVSTPLLGGFCGIATVNSVFVSPGNFNAANIQAGGSYSGLCGITITLATITTTNTNYIYYYWATGR